jgi:capsular exopolysaccharide synthesis family protein
VEPSENLTPEWTLKEYLEIVRRRKWAVLETFGLILGIGVLATALTTPIYRASGKLLVRETAPSLNTVDTQNPLVDLLALAQPEGVETQIEVLQSAPFVERVMQKAGVPSWEERRPPVLHARRVRETNVIDVSVESPDAKMAARVANTMLSEYLEYTGENSLKEIRAAKRFVQGERQRAEGALAAAEGALLRFRKRNRVAQLTAEQESRTRELVDLETGFRQNANAITRVTAQLAEVNTQLAAEPKVERLPSGRINPRLDTLEGKLEELETQRAALLEEYRAHTPQVAVVDAQIARLRLRLEKEPEERVTDLTSANPARGELVARRKEMERERRSLYAERDALSAQLASKRERMNQLGPWEIELAQLTRARETAEKSFLLLDEKLQDLSIRENARRSTARIIEPADLPSAPVRPRKAVNFVLAAAIGLVLGLCVAFLQEYLDDRVTSPDEVERTLALPVLGYIPMVPAHQSPLMTALSPRSAIAESYRALRSSITFAGVDHPLRTLVVSSASQSEGKSLTSMNLAIAIAMDGRRVILVDADLRRPSVHRMLSWEMAPGLTELLVGTRELGEVLREVPDVPGLRVLTSGAMPPNPAELLNSAPMASLIERLAELADVIIFDCPPCLPVTDALLLSAKVDGVLLVADIQEARRAGLKHTRDQFDRARARLVGLVFNKVGAGASRSYQYYGRGYYYGEPLPANGNGHTNGNGTSEKKRLALMGTSRNGEEDR